jgi:hypothetical protein
MAGLLDFLQAASNAAASNVSGPVDAINWLLSKAGVPVSQSPVGGSQWMEQKGLTRKVPQGAASVLGETAGLLAPFAVAAKAPQIAGGLNQMVANAQTPATMNRQMGAVNLNPYQIDHKPMTEAGGAARLHDLSKSFGEDIYGPNALQFFGSGDYREKGVVNLLKSLRDKPDAKVTIYRGVPKDAAGINPGDWVTLDKKAAADYAAQHPSGKVLKLEVPASHVTSWPDSLLEFGYFPPGP